MLRLVFSVALGLLFSISYGQLKKFYSLQSCSGYDTVNFSLEASAGNCLIKSSSDEIGPLNIYGNPDLDKVNPSFKALVKNNSCFVDLALQEYKSSSIGDGIFFAMLGSGTNAENNYWKILFDNDKIYDLNMNYGFGQAEVDLSGTSVSGLKIKSGSADVVVDYGTRQENMISMDTFMVRVDMGSLVARNVDCARARTVIANVGFGQALLDFSRPNKSKCNVQASVGAGNLEIHLPKEKSPVIIYVKDSPLCGIKLASGFERVEKNVYVNMHYSAEAENLLTFNLDVAMGNVSFSYVD